MQVAQGRQHLRAGLGAGQWVAVVQHLLDLRLEGLQLQQQAVARVGEFVVVAGPDRFVRRDRAQQARGDIVQVPVFGLHCLEAFEAPQFARCGFVIPLAEPALTGGIAGKVALVDRQAADNRPQQILVPQVMAVDRLFQGAQ